jgi:hypothetical protein
LGSLTEVPVISVKKEKKTSVRYLKIISDETYMVREKGKLILSYY